MKYNITEASIDDLELLAIQFDLYRQFYTLDSNIDACKKYLRSRLENQECKIFKAQIENGAVVGFTQIYTTFSSISLNRIHILYDLFVEKDYRKFGIGRALMNKATEFAKSEGVSHIQLSTAKDNKIAQALYESLKYKRDEDFYDYELNVEWFVR